MIPSFRISKFLKPGFSVAIISASLLINNSFAGPAGDAASDGNKSAGAPTTLSDIAEREMVRRLQRVKDAEIAIEDGQAMEADSDFDGARKKYMFALQNIPRAPLVQSKRDKATKLFADVSAKLAHERATEGRREEAKELLDAILVAEVSPNHQEAKKILVRLQDPEWYNHALTPEHVQNVAEVDRLLKVAQGYFSLGDFDNAEKQYDAVLRIDRYNTAARRGQEEVEKERRDYLKSARSHTRGRLMRQVDEAWETQVPLLSVEGRDIGGGGDDSTGREYIARKLRETIIPTVLFDEATVDEAIEFLRQKK